MDLARCSWPEGYELTLIKFAPAATAITRATASRTLLDASKRYVVIGKNPDYKMVASLYDNASVLNLPNKWAHLPRQQAAKYLWRQNSSQLRSAVRDGYVPYDIGYGGNFYAAERLTLGYKGLHMKGNVWVK